MLKEEIDSAGTNAGNVNTDSHFKYIVDKRIEQGFTVVPMKSVTLKNCVLTDCNVHFAVFDEVWDRYPEVNVFLMTVPLFHPAKR